MRKFYFYILFLFAIIQACVNVNEKSIQYLDFQCVDSVLIRKIDTGHVAFTDVVRLKSDSLLVVYREGKSHIDTSSKIIKQVGSPDGKTWNQPQILYDDSLIDDRDPSLTVLDDGTVLMNFFKYVRGDSKTQPTIVKSYVLQSTDNGVSFSEPLQMGEGILDNSIYYLSKDSIWVDSEQFAIKGWACSSGICKYKNKLILPTYGGYPLVRRPDTKIFVSPVSTINLFEKYGTEDWISQEIQIPNTDTLWLQEPALLNLGDSILIIHVRTSTGKSIFNPGKMAQSISSDGGKTWSPIKLFPFIGHSPELYITKDKIVFSVFRYVNDEYTEESVAFIYSIDNCKTWSKPVMIEHCGEKECGYPAMLELTEDEIMFVYYANDGLAIKAKIYKKI